MPEGTPREFIRDYLSGALRLLHQDERVGRERLTGEHELPAGVVANLANGGGVGVFDAARRNRLARQAADVGASARPAAARARRTEPDLDDLESDKYELEREPCFLD